MWIENNDKVRTKVFLRSDIESNITNICDVSNRIQDTISAINRATAGSVVGSDDRMIDECKRSLQEMSEALQGLYLCRNFAEQLETREWVDDE